MTDSATPGAPGGRLWTDADARRSIRIPVAGDDKYTRGVLGVRTGSSTYPGAAVLGVEAAARAGAGMIRYLGPDRATAFVLQRRPEVVPAEGRVQAWLLGSGMDAASRGASDTAALRRALTEGVPVVIDSGALDLVGEVAGPAVITPHYRELARVLSATGAAVSADAVASDAAGWAVRAAERLGLTVLLKGNTTWVADPDGTLLRVRSGPAWLATAGSGDVLGGILGAFTAAHADRLAATRGALAEVAASAAHLHGLAGARASAGGPLVALDIATAVAPTIAALLDG